MGEWRRDSVERRWDRCWYAIEENQDMTNMCFGCKQPITDEQPSGKDFLSRLWHTGCIDAQSEGFLRSVAGGAKGKGIAPRPPVSRHL